jgi:hypothetical protein
MQFSSVGALSERWFTDDLVPSFSAGTVEQEASPSSSTTTAQSTSTQTTTPSTKSMTTSAASSTAQLRKKSKVMESPYQLRLIWPTVSFVRNSIDGYRSGGSLCFPESNLKDFLRFYQFVAPPARSSVPPHIKTVTRANMDSSDQRLPWICLTSCNLSKAAWGEMQKNGSQLFIRHYEMGVLLLPSAFGLDSFQANWPTPQNAHKEKVRKRANERHKNGRKLTAVPSNSGVYSTSVSTSIATLQSNRQTMVTSEGVHFSFLTFALCSFRLWDVRYFEPDIYGTNKPRNVDKYASFLQFSSTMLSTTKGHIWSPN